MKTIGLAALLHQCGLRPPADAAALPVFDQVLADIGDRQSIEMSLSTFSAHLSALVSILESATDRSLVLLDELAAGTDPEEGSALAQALLARLVRQARLTVVTTHYPELKEWASASGEAVNGATGFDPETDEPLYRIALGRPGTSHALRIAERLGLDRAVVADARARVAPERLRSAELLAEAEAAERAAVALRESLEEALGGARAREAELQREREQVQASAERARRDAIAETERDLAEARASCKLRAATCALPAGARASLNRIVSSVRRPSVRRGQSERCAISAGRCRRAARLPRATRSKRRTSACAAPSPPSGVRKPR